MNSDGFSILFITRASLYTIRGGDTIQVIQTAEALRREGITVDIRLCNEKTINYPGYQLIHFFNIHHPADMLVHIKESKLPYVISTIYVNYAKPVKRKTSGLRDGVLNLFGSNAQEYIKTVGKSIFKGEKIISRNYIRKGHKRSVQWILSHADLLLPNSENEYKRLFSAYGIEKKYSVIPNGADTGLFCCSQEEIGLKDSNMVLCVARFELIKNQLNLIRALNNTAYQLYLIGDPAPNHRAYYQACKKAAGPNVHFINAMPQPALVDYYKKAKVHVLPSWFETTGLSSIEALYCGCNIVVTKYGDTQDYFDPSACFYCDPASVTSIREAVEQAAVHVTVMEYIDIFSAIHNWHQAAEKTLMAYRQVLISNKQ